MIYLDHNATTPVRRRVLDAMVPYWEDNFGNASSFHRIGREAKTALENYIKGLELNDKLQRVESREYFEKAVEEDPEFAIAHLNLAFVQANTKAFMTSFNNAKKYIEKISAGEKYWILGFEAGAINGGMMKREESGKYPVIVIEVDSIDKYLENIEKSGGMTIFPKQKIEEMGFYARFSDTEGNTIGLWQTI